MKITEARKRVKAANTNVESYIERNTDRSSRYSVGLSQEGWDGGYAQALRDVALLLDGIEPGDNRSRKFWVYG